MTRLVQRAVFGALAIATLATIAVAFVSFARKVDSFAGAGFTASVDGGALLLTSVEPQGAAARAGLRTGDRIILADGQTASSLSNPAKALSRPPLPHRLVVISGGEVRGISLGEPSVHADVRYLFLAFVGFLYLIIGLFTIARDRTAPAAIFWALCLCSFAVYVLTPAGAHDTLWRIAWVAEDVYRAFLPALLLHFFLVFPRRIATRRFLPLLYVPAFAYIALEAALLGAAPTPKAAALLEGATRFWFVYFAVYVVAVLARLLELMRRRPEDAEAEKQIRWIGLGVIVGLAPFLILSALPRAFGLESPLLSTLAVVPLVLIPLAFAYAILKWRLWDVEIFVREAIATTGAVLLGGMTFVLVNSLLDRTFETMATAGKNVVAFGSGIVLASLLVPVKKRITDVLERIQYHDTYRARRALLDVARDFATPRPREEVVRAIVQRVEDALRVVPCSLFLFEGPARDPDAGALQQALTGEDALRLRGTAFGASPPAALVRFHSLGYRAFFAMRCGGELVGALGVGYKDGRIPLSSEDEALLVAVLAQASLAYENARLYGALAQRLEEIRTLQEYQESVIRSSSSGIVVVDAAERIHSANPAFALLVGRSEEELTGLPLSDALPGVALGVPPEDGGEWRFEAALHGQDGEERNLQLSVSTFHGSSERRVVVVEDMTDRIRSERALAERERLASLGVLAAGVAHEVNTPIAGLSSYAQILLSETPPADPRYAILKKMERQTFRAAHLVNNLLEFARPRPRASQKTDLRAVLANAAESVETTFAGRRLELDVDPAGDPAFVTGDARELEQVFVNLLTNARDASPEGGVVSCRLERNNGNVRVVVADRGAGVDTKTAQDAFRPFYTTKKSGGTGLGLAISRDIVRRHGGEIVLEARDGGGAQARVDLPLAAETVS
ncbi:MAG TPA: ATP-binding protein [Thermoanaerobaculia bacterium]|nr:ATP-binding protein [Thermoanaerobaculia bacterium]